MLGTPSQMQDDWERAEASANARHQVYQTAMQHLENYGNASFYSCNGEEVNIDLMDTIEECQDDELWALLSTFWQKKRNGTATEASTAAGALFEKLDRVMSESVETFL